MEIRKIFFIVWFFYVVRFLLRLVGLGVALLVALYIARKKLKIKVNFTSFTGFATDFVKSIKRSLKNPGR